MGRDLSFLVSLEPFRRRLVTYYSAIQHPIRKSMPATALEFGQHQPLTVNLRGLIRKYPKGVGIFKEFLQNADDAGATSLNAFLDHRTHASNNLPIASMASLQGRSLVFVNEKPFSPEDWSRIQQIGNSGKALDGATTGRFGFGFNSVYHVTDYPMILTRHRLGIFDPHGNVATLSEGKNGSAWTLAELWEHHPDLLLPFTSFGLEVGQVDFDGTIFRLPLRNEEMASKSKISKEPFTNDDFLQIVSSTEESASKLILFLKSVAEFNVEEVFTDGTTSQVFSIATENANEVALARSELRNWLAADHMFDQLRNAGSKIWRYSHKLKIESATQNNVETWSIVRGLYSNENLICAAEKMFAIDEKAIPFAGAAVQLSKPVDNNSLSCALPLAKSSGMPVHVDGFFDLSDSRQDLSCLDSVATGNASVTRDDWNKSLLKHGCAEAVSDLLENLGKSCGEPIYQHWPRVPVVINGLVDQLPKMIYESLLGRECIANGVNGNFVTPGVVRNAPKKIRELLVGGTIAVPKHQIPKHVVDGFNAAGQAIEDLTPRELRQFLREQAVITGRMEELNAKCSADSEWVLAFLDFCLKDKDHNDFQNVPLALMSDGTLRVFGNDSSGIFIGSPTEKYLLSAIPGLFLNDQVCEREGFERLPSVVSMTLANLIELLPRSFQTTDNGQPLNVDPTNSRLPTFEWLTEFFTYCSYAFDSQRVTQLLNFKTILRLPFVPDCNQRLWAMGWTSTPVFIPEREQATWKSELLAAAGIETVSTAGPLGKAIHEFKSKFSGVEIQTLTPNVLIKTLTKNPGTALSLLALNRHYLNSLLAFFAANVGHDIPSPTRQLLASMKIFPLDGGGFTALAGTAVYLPTDFTPPNVSFDSNVLETLDGRLTQFYEALGVGSLTRVKYIRDFVLSGFEHIDEGKRLAALSWLRGEYQFALMDLAPEEREGFKREVGNSKLIVCTDGNLHAPNEVYHPDCNEVLRLLGQTACFPDLKFYESADWLDFFETIGMERRARPCDVLTAIDLLVQQPVTTNVIYQINELAKFIDLHWDEIHQLDVGGESFSDALKGRNWMPAICRCPNDIPKSLFLMPQAAYFAPAEIIHHDDFDLVSSVEPACVFPIGRKMAAGLGISRPSIESVLIQLDNCLAAVGDEKVNARTKKMLFNIYDAIGTSLKANSSSSLSGNLRAKYFSTKCLIDSNDRLWAPKECFESAVAFFLGLRSKVRYEKESLERFAGVVGRNAKPTTDDFRYFFFELSSNMGTAEIAGDNRKKLVQAYVAAAKNGSPGEFATSCVLSDSGILRPSSEVLINDARWLSERAAAVGVEFLASEFGPEIATAFSVGQLSKVVSEKIEGYSPCENQDMVGVCEKMNQCVNSKEFLRGLLRLVRPEARNQIAFEELQGFKVLPVSKLTTSLSREGEILDGSQGPSTAILVDKVLFIDTDRDNVLINHVATTISSRIFDEVQFQNTTCIPSMLREQPQYIQSLLDDSKIPDLPADCKIELLGDLDEFADHGSDLESSTGNLVMPALESPHAGSGASNPQINVESLGVRSPGIVGNSVGALSIPNVSMEGSVDSSDISKPRSRKGQGRRSTDGSSRSRRAVSYAISESNGLKITSSSTTKNRDVDAAAIEAVRVHELQHRQPEVMEHFNKGYDVESSSNGMIERYIEIKGLGGRWDGFGVALSPAQFEFGIEKGDSFWLYVVEFALDEKLRNIYMFQNPIGKITEHRFDCGWKQFCTETTTSVERKPTEGSRVSVEGKGEGVVVSISEHGKIGRVKIRLDSGENTSLTYPNRSISVVK